MKPTHILNQMGILVSFSVAKKITEEDIKAYFKKQKKLGKSEAQIGKLLRKKIVEDIEEAVYKNQIPGLVTPQEIAKDMGMEQSIVDKIPELSHLVMVIVNKMMEKKYDKMSLCYFINSLVNMLGLSESDFEKFHTRNSGEDDDDDDDDDEFHDA